MTIMRNAIPIAAAIFALLAMSYCATRPLAPGDSSMLTDPNLPTIKYIGREHPDERFKFGDRPVPAATVQSSH